MPAAAVGARWCNRNHTRVVAQWQAPLTDGGTTQLRPSAPAHAPAALLKTDKQGFYSPLLPGKPQRTANGEEQRRQGRLKRCCGSEAARLAHGNGMDEQAGPCFLRCMFSLDQA
ncbi:MAG: hypothetical protein IMW89_17310 [Ktedonobacteraceae bacterium]|nr:hypothetical protein [Ktedonobacteraceae bacterium]